MERSFQVIGEDVVLPVVDLSPVLGDAYGQDTREKSLETLAQLARGCEDLGMVHLVNHGMSESVLRSAFDVAEEFFRGDQSIKDAVRRSEDNARGYFDDEFTKNSRDAKEGFDYGLEDNGVEIDGRNRWPEMDKFRVKMEEYFWSLEEFAFKLTNAFAVLLERDIEELGELFAKHTSFCRFNYYNDHGGNLGIHNHKDAGFFTLLLTNGVPGLQVYIGSGEGADHEHELWKTVRPRADAICFNVGDMFQVLSNDRFRSPIHRVKSVTMDTRVSAAFFWNPSSDVPIRSLPSGGADTAYYKPLTFGEFRRRRFEGDFSNVGKEIQISDYRIA